MRFVTSNLSGRVRHTKLNGRDHVVAPVVAMKSTVMSGSDGPLFYPAHAIEETSTAWEGVPITAGHPITARGENVPVNHAEAVDKKIGLFRRVQATDGVLRGEVWLDVKKTKNVAPEILTRLENEDQIEVSTGLFVWQQSETGTFDGKAYHAVASRLRPDHLAILQHEVGACSVADGCGVLANSAYDAELSKWAAERCRRERNKDLVLNSSKRQQIGRPRSVESFLAEMEQADIRRQIDRKPLNRPTINWKAPAHDCLCNAGTDDQYRRTPAMLFDEIAKRFGTLDPINPTAAGTTVVPVLDLGGPSKRMMAMLGLSTAKDDDEDEDDEILRCPHLF